MSDNQEFFLSQGTEFLGDLNAKLRDLRGYGVLMNELLQNADDAKNPAAHIIVFDVRDEALVVENDGIFSDCGQMQERECPWRSDNKIGHRCDFHRFRRIAGADKRREEETTGAFGIGFISVYQITDRPELISNGWHWSMFPDNAESERIGTKRDATQCGGTRFILPWAFDHSTIVRTELGVPVLSDQDVEDFFGEISEAASKAILFLKNIETIEIKRNGQLRKRVSRINEKNKILVADGDKTQLWYTFNGNFTEIADRLKSRYVNLIEAKRKPNTVIALASENMNATGVYCATLPTKQSTHLPLHINADFFTPLSRKSISFENNEQGKWNDAAVRAASASLTAGLFELRDLLGHKALWELLSKVKHIHDEAKQGQHESVLTAFWEDIQLAAKQLPMFYSSEGKWLKSDEIVVLKSPEDRKCRDLMVTLGIKVVHPDLRKYEPLFTNLGVKELNPFDIADALREADLDDTARFPFADAPAWLQSHENQKLLADVICVLMQRPENRANSLMRERLQACAIALSADDHFCAINSLRRTPHDVIATLAPFGVAGRLMAPLVPEGLHILIDELNANRAIRLLEEVEQRVFNTIWKEQPERIIALIEWLSSYAEAFAGDIAVRDQAKRLRIWPSGEALFTLNELFVPGDFTDPFGQTSVIDERVVSKRRAFLLNGLKAKELNFETYVTKHLPDLFRDARRVSREQCHELVQMLAQHRQVIQDTPIILTTLAKFCFIECTDGELHSANETYFESGDIQNLFGDSVPTAQLPSGSNSAIERLYEMLGVAKKPRPDDVVGRIKALTERPPLSANREAIRKVFAVLAAILINEPDATYELYKQLKELQWLPAEGQLTTWFTPAKVKSCFAAHIFKSTGRFLDIERQVQTTSSKFRDFLGITTDPTCHEVVRHLMNCIAKDEKPHDDVYKFLNRNDNVNHPVINELKGKDSIWLEDEYISPRRLFWQPLAFAPYLLQLGESYRNLNALFSRLGVREEPEPEDIISVLRNISAEWIDKPLDENTFHVVKQCWRFLNQCIAEERLDTEDLAELSDEPVIPNRAGYLRIPSFLFYEDRPNLKARFNDYFDDAVIDFTREEGGAMEAAGLRPLSTVIETRIVEQGNLSPADIYYRLIEERLPLIERSIFANGGEWNATEVRSIKIILCSPLRIGYSTVAFGERKAMPPDNILAYYDRKQNTVYVQNKESPAVWSALARELCAALHSSESASYVKDVLSAKTFEDAKAILDELDCPLLPSRSEVEVAFSAPVEFAEEDLTAEDFSTDIEEDEVFETADELDSDGEDAAVNEEQIVSAHNQSANIKEWPSDALPLKEATWPDVNVPLAPTETPANTSSLYEEDDYSANRPHTLQFEDDFDSGRSQQNSILSQNARSTNDGGNRQAGAHRNSRERQNEGQTPSRQGGRLRSYVFPSDETQEPDTERQEKRSTTGRAGAARVMAFEIENSRNPQEMEHFNPGFDILSTDNNGEVRYIEVKSLSQYWGDTGVGLSDRQFAFAQQKGDTFWLYVVECAADDKEFSILRIQNPANRVSQFLFDDGWRDLTAASDISDLLLPIVKNFGAQ